jgi:hypothetical protein
MPGARCTRGLVCNVCVEMHILRALLFQRDCPAGEPTPGQYVARGLAPKRCLRQDDVID